MRLEDLLNDLADDGVKESSGSFTLDPKKAEEKLRNFSFASPHDYLLKIIQCAVANGADSVEVRTGTGEVTVDFDGAGVAEDEVASLVGYLLSQELAHDQRRFRHLAAGLRGAAACNPEAVIFDFTTGTQRARRIWDKAGWRQVTSPLGKAEAPHKFLLDRTFGQSVTAARQEFASAMGAGQTPEESLLSKRCRYAPCRIILDGEAVLTAQFGQPRYPGYEIEKDPNPGEARPPRYIRSGFFLKDDFMSADHHLIEKLVPATDLTPGCLPLPNSHATIRLEHPAAGYCHAWLAVAAALEAPRIVYVEDGVVVQQEDAAADIGVPGFIAVVSVSGLQKDLTGFQLVRDERFRLQREWLQSQALELRAALLRRLDLFPNRERLQEVLGS